jgi:hypothetical protein
VSAALRAERIVQAGFGAYTGTSELKDGASRILPWQRCLRKLSAGKLRLSRVLKIPCEVRRRRQGGQKQLCMRS